MLVVYVAHALGAGPDRERNRANASKWVAYVASQGHVPVADWIVLSGEFDETPANRERGLAIDLKLIERCDALWLCGGRISPGMQLEADHATACGIPVVDCTPLGAMPPEVA